MPAQIKFGTDGWRAIIARDFTFANVARCAQGLSDYLKERGTAGQGLVVGYDTRFLSREFAETVAQVAAANGLHVLLADKAAPTPVISFSVLHRHAGAAAIITASHNAASYNGFKFKPEYGGSATQEITDRLEACIQAVRRPRITTLAKARAKGLVEEFDPAPPYLARIGSLVHLPAIQNAGLKVMVDAMYGAGAGYIPTLISGGRTTVEELHGIRNPAFPGMEQPEPIAHNLTELARCVPLAQASVGLALDGDADRVGLLDETGAFITTLQVFSLLALYLLEQKGERGALVKGVTSSSMLNQLGEKFGVAVHEMPVGFKHIGPKFAEVDALMGGEESGGFAFRGHIPERDGILSALYLLEFMARTGKSPAALVRHLFDQVGPHYYHRRDVTFDPADRARILERLNSNRWTDLAGMPIRQWDRIDGRRLILDKAWLAARFSGTEPLLRIYCEADQPQTVQKLLDAAAEYLGV